MTTLQSVTLVNIEKNKNDNEIRTDYLNPSTRLDQILINKKKKELVI